ncbi:hypothetical protein Val02_13660 [Virgisporangium aliadipatigenens]|uniref:Ankyrin repeat domain-containing protein n=1 Tax=Virgisporangium aliadipatigenens TaxID=741659 RepID=A0A8J3YI75_9ACTN|nr:ankyrin repeat domain-containing protein [Virgisporangium aliadipatigenens]GIJ44480.1 hypothetical protein Val02_13660 [Virgisporangium aliadipatigenens]
MPVVDIVLLSVIGLTLAGLAWVLLRVAQQGRAQRRHENELADRDRRVAAVYTAAVEGGTGLARVLDGGADVDAQDRSGDTALHRAFYEGAAARSTKRRRLPGYQIVRMANRPTVTWGTF